MKSKRAVYEAYLKQLYTVEKCTRIQGDAYKEMGRLEQHKRENLRRWRQMIQEEPSAPASRRTPAAPWNSAPAPIAGDRGVDVGTTARGSARRLFVNDSRANVSQEPARAAWMQSDLLAAGAASSADPEPTESPLHDSELSSANDRKHQLPLAPVDTRMTRAQPNTSLVRAHADVLLLENGATDAERAAGRKLSNSIYSNDRSRARTAHASDTRSVARSTSRHTAASAASARVRSPPVPLTKKQQELEANLARIRESTRSTRSRKPRFDRLLNQVTSFPIRSSAQATRFTVI